MGLAKITFVPVLQDVLNIADRVVWRPLEPSQPPLFLQTWEEVSERLRDAFFLSEGRGTISIQLASDVEIEGNATWRRGGSETKFVGYNNQFPKPTLTLLSNLSDVGRFTGVTVKSPLGRNILISDLDFIVLDNADLVQETPLRMVITVGQLFVFQNRSSIVAHPDASGVFRPSSEGLPIYNFILDLGGDIPSNIFDDLFSNTVFVFADASVREYPTTLPLSLARTNYAEGVACGVSPTLNVSTAQEAMDVLKRRTTGSGPTASRPAIPSEIDTGGMYFDTDLGFSVYSNGTFYVDGLGNPA